MHGVCIINTYIEDIRGLESGIIPYVTHASEVTVCSGRANYVYAVRTQISHSCFSFHVAYNTTPPAIKVIARMLLPLVINGVKLHILYVSNK